MTNRLRKAARDNARIRRNRITIDIANTVGFLMVLTAFLCPLWWH